MVVVTAVFALLVATPRGLLAALQVRNGAALQGLTLLSTMVQRLGTLLSA